MSERTHRRRGALPRGRREGPGDSVRPFRRARPAGRSRRSGRPLTRPCAGADSHRFCAPACCSGSPRRPARISRCPSRIRSRRTAPQVLTTSSRPAASPMAAAIASTEWLESAAPNSSREMYEPRADHLQHRPGNGPGTDAGLPHAPVVMDPTSHADRRNHKRADVAQTGRIDWTGRVAYTQSSRKGKTWTLWHRRSTVRADG